MHIVILFGLIFLLGIGVALVFFIKSPKLTSKQTVVDTLLSVNDPLFSLRQETRSILNDTINLYNSHDQAAFAARKGNLQRYRQSIEQKLQLSRTHLVNYAKVAAQKSFYSLAMTTIDTVSRSIDDLDMLVNDATAFDMIMIQIEHINSLSLDTAMVTYVNDEDTETAKRVDHHIASIVSLIQQVQNQLTETTLQTHEFTQVAQSVANVLQQSERSYSSLRSFLVTQPYMAYRTQQQAMPTFYATFDISSYDAIINAALIVTPEDSLMNDLRQSLYQ